MNPLPPGRTRRAPAPELSTEERAAVERFEAARPAPESFRHLSGCARLAKPCACPAAGWGERAKDWAAEVPTANAWNWGGTDMTPRP